MKRKINNPLLLIGIVAMFALSMMVESVGAEDTAESTKTISYDNTDMKWNYDSVVISPQNVQHPGETIQIRVNTSGDTEGLQYKFVWQKDNWEKWGVLKEFGESSVEEFTLDEVGRYKLYVDVKDGKGEVKTKVVDYMIRTKIWSFDDIATSLASPQEKYVGPIEINAKTNGENDELQYKFVWQKNNWKEWGIVQDFSSLDSAKWNPKEVGEYTIYVDVKDEDGNIVTRTIKYEIIPVQWSIGTTMIEPEEIQKKGEKVTIKANTLGTIEGLQYKFVWQKDNWEKWGVIQNFSKDAAAVWETPKEAGDYKIYIDVKDRDGQICTMTTEYTLVSQIWSHDGLTINDGVSSQVCRKLPVKVQTSGDTEGLQYKFVWQKDNWNEWGVIQNFSTSSVAEWYPTKEGTYKIYSDVKDLDGRVQTAVQEYTVLGTPWKIDEIKAEAESSYFVGDNVDIEVITSGEQEGLQYKFVAKYGNDWSDWEVLQDFSEKRTAAVNIKKSGDCTIYVDVKDIEGVVFNGFQKVITGHIFNNVVITPSYVKPGENVIIKPNISGDEKGLKCKFVWQKNNWEEWGIIKDWSTECSVQWTNLEEGQYYIYIDAELNGIVKSQKAVLSIFKNPKYVRDSRYYPIGYSVNLPNGGYDVSTANIGLKVIEINKKLRGTDSASYSSLTKTAVTVFQRSKGLPQTGIVDKNTWLAMGLSEDDWYNLGTYRTPIKTNYGSDKQDYINAMLKTAKEYTNKWTPYRIGCSGKPGSYVDCSGLIYQCLYSIGINPSLNIVDHALAKYEYCSYYLAADEKLGPTINYKNIKAGDIIFYSKSGKNTVCHVAIYAGNGMIYDSWPSIGVTYRSVNISGYKINKIRRVIV